MRSKSVVTATSIFLLFSLVTHPGCRREKVPETYRPTNAHEDYLHFLRLARLADTALGGDWIAASRKSLREPVVASPPFEEVFYADPKEAFAVAYRFQAKKGQRIELDVVFSGQKPPRLFIDLFRAPDSDGREWLQVASADKETNRLVFEPRREGEYIVRLQPELLRGGQFKITIRVAASLGFPVKGQDTRSIGGGFDALRDGGRRLHRGVDIFARRHTEVLAPAKAQVRFVGENDLGGNTIWLYDTERSMYYYFAHLQTQSVKAGTEVEAGRVIGTVGNSGNAKRTPPHLHFGIYAEVEGAVDPYYFIARTYMVPLQVVADLESLGRWVRSKAPKVSLKVSAEARSRDVLALDSQSAMLVLAASGGTYRVLLPDGTSGYVQADSVEPAERALENPEAADLLTVREAPADDAAAKESVGKGEAFSVLGEYKGFWLVKTNQGRTGWIQIPIVSMSGRHPDTH